MRGGSAYCIKWGNVSQKKKMRRADGGKGSGQLLSWPRLDIGLCVLVGTKGGRGEQVSSFHLIKFTGRRSV